MTLPSHLLALRLKQNEKYSNIMAIQSPTGTLIELYEINLAFKTYYPSLYSSEVVLNAGKYKQFFKDLQLPTLSDQDSEKLNASIMLQDLK